ncbi:MAG TPA: hypothetical protein VGE35_01945 [Candidatus Paceibacterota bacterium]
MEKSLVIQRYAKAYQVAQENKQFTLGSVLEEVKDPVQANNLARISFNDALRRLDDTVAISLFSVLVAAERDMFFKDNIRSTEVRPATALAAAHTGFELHTDSETWLRFQAKTIGMIKILLGDLPYGIRDKIKAMPAKEANGDDQPAFPRLRVHLWDELRRLQPLQIDIDSVLCMFAQRKYSYHIDAERLKELAKHMISQVPADSRATVAAEINGWHFEDPRLRLYMTHAVSRCRLSELSATEALRELCFLDKIANSARFDYFEMALKDLLAVEEALKIFLSVKEKDLPTVGQLKEVPGLDEREFTLWHYQIEYPETDAVVINLQWSNLMDRRDKSVRDAAEAKLENWARHWFKSTGYEAGIKFITLNLSLQRSIVLGEREATP